MSPAAPSLHSRIHSSPSLLYSVQPIATSQISSCKSCFSPELSPLKIVTANVHAMAKNRNKHTTILQVRSSLETAGATVGEVTEDAFWPIVSAAGDKTVILDMYTQW
ncbi:hypothetical protein SLE2022_054050 [Rubroshorea leprosula]